MSNVSRILISRQHLKEVPDLFCYDGIQRCKESKTDSKVLEQLVKVLFDISKSQK